MSSQPILPNEPEPTNANEAEGTAPVANVFNIDPDRFVVPDEVAFDESSPDAIAKQLQEMKDLLAAMQEALAPIDEAKNSAKAQGKALEEQARKHYEQARAYDVMAYDMRKKLRAAERVAESGERKLQQSLALQAAAQEFARMETTYSEILAGQAYFAAMKEHQRTGAMQMAYNQQVILADTMGLGKTLTAQIACDLVDAKKILVLCPSPVMDTFEKEIKLWSPHRGTVLPIGGKPKAQREFALTMAKDLEYCVVICNYEAWRKDKNLIDQLVACKFDTVIMDEAHNIKDIKTIAWRGCKSICYAENLTYDDDSALIEQYESQRNGFFAKCSVRNIFPMTGTPILNKPQELYALLHLVDPVNFRREYDFLYDYCTQNYDGKWVFRPGGLDRLTKKIANRFIRRTRHTAGIVLPERTIQIHDLTLDPEIHPRQYADAKALSEKAMILVDEAEGKAILPSMILELILRKRQVMTWPAGIQIKDRDGVVILKCETEESVKLDYIIKPNGPNNSYADAEGLLPEVISDEKVLIFSQFKAPLHELQRRCDLAGIRAAIIDGDVPMAERTVIQDKFNSLPVGDPGGYDVILGNYKALGVGLTLNAATQTIIVDEEWNPGKRDQAYDRNYRIGQDKETTVHVLRVRNSVDMWMADLMETKEQMIEGFNQQVDLTSEMRKRLTEGDF